MRKLLQLNPYPGHNAVTAVATTIATGIQDLPGEFVADDIVERLLDLRDDSPLYFAQITTETLVLVADVNRLGDSGDAFTQKFRPDRHGLPQISLIHYACLVSRDMFKAGLDVGTTDQNEVTTKTMVSLGDEIYDALFERVGLIENIDVMSLHAHALFAQKAEHAFVVAALDQKGDRNYSNSLAAFCNMFATEPRGFKCTATGDGVSMSIDIETIMKTNNGATWLAQVGIDISSLVNYGFRRVPQSSQDVWVSPKIEEDLLEQALVAVWPHDTPEFANMTTQRLRTAILAELEEIVVDASKASAVTRAKDTNTATGVHG